MNKKFSVLILAALLGIGLGFGSCNGNAESEKNAPASQGQPAADSVGNASGGTVEAGGMDQAQKGKVLDAYLQVKDALVGTDGAAAAEAAKGLVSALGDSEGELAKKIRFDAEHISETEDVGHQRDHFSSLSGNIFELVKGAGLGKKLYRQYCPMAFDGKGAYWVSSEEEIMNPYFGDKMLHCGKVEEEI